MSSVRRSQAERSAATREALLDAAIECLIDQGYASTTTNAVAVRAGVSRGAHLHHFQTRTALVGAAVEELAQRWLGELRKATRTLPDGPERTLGAWTCCGRTTRRRSIRARWTCGPTRVRTTSCATS